MRSMTDSCWVGAPPDRVWAYLADYDQLLCLASSTAVSAHVQGEQRRAGAEYDASLSWEGMKSMFRARLAAADPPTTLTWVSGSHGGECSVQFDLDPEPPGTRVTATLKYGSCPASVPLEPFAWGMLVPLFRRTLRKIHTLDRVLASED